MVKSFNKVGHFVVSKPCEQEKQLLLQSIKLVSK
jgi:hypothetical protein